MKTIIIFPKNSNHYSRQFVKNKVVNVNYIVMKILFYPIIFGLVLFIKFRYKLTARKSGFS